MARRGVKYAVGQHVRVQTSAGIEAGEITRLPVPPSDVLLTGSPYYVLNVFDVETHVHAHEILGAIPDLKDVGAVEAWLDA